MKTIQYFAKRAAAVMTIAALATLPTHTSSIRFIRGSIWLSTL